MLYPPHWRRTFIPALFLVCGAVAAASAAERPLREAKSENAQFEFKVKPGRVRTPEDRENTARRARGVLTHKEDRESHQGQKVWTATLVNEFAPVHGFVTNDGRFVVTLNEAGRGGAAHAVAIYDETGRLIRELSLRDLLSREDWRRVRVRRNAIDWLGGAKMKLAERDTRLEIALRWGTKIEIELARGEMINPPEPVAEADLPAAVVAALRGEEKGDADGDSAAPPDLNELARQLQEGATLEADELLALQAALERNEILVDCEAAEALAAALEAQSALIPDNYADRPPAGNSGELGVAVPHPDPAAPVDYIEWMKAQSMTPGPNASDAYQAAMDSVEPFEGDQELFDRAMEGDPVAIADPAIQAWIEQNRTAIEYIKEGNRLDYRGMPITAGEDGMMIGILLPHLSQMRQVAKTMAVDGRARELSGDFAGAHEQYVEILKLGAQNGQGPTLIENLVGIAEQHLGAQRLLDSFENDVEGAVDYSTLAEQLEQSYGAVRPMAETLQFERAFILDIIQRGYEYDADANVYRVSERGLKSVSEALSMAGDGGIAPVMLGMYLGNIGFERLSDQANDVYDRMTSAAAAPFAEGRSEFQQLEEEIGSPGFKLSNPILAMLTPSVSRARELQTRADTTRNATLLVTNLMAYRQKYGSFPDSLDALGDRPFVADPFSGGRFAYRREGDDFVLYSTGPNGTDEGGVHDPKFAENDVRYWPRPPRQK